MQKYKTLFFVFIISLTLLNFVILFDHPLEGGLILGLLACVWLSVLVFRYSEFRISRGFIIALLFCAYIFWFRQFSYPVPANIFMVFTSFLFLLYAFLLYPTLTKESARLIWENSLIIAGLVISIVALIEITFFSYQHLLTRPLIIALNDLSIPFRLTGLLFVHPNVLAGFLNFVWPIIFIRLVTTPRKSEKLLWCLPLILMGVIFIYTNSRGGVVGAILAGVFLFYRSVKVEANKETVNRRPISRSYLRSSALGIGSLLVLTFIAVIIWRAIDSGQIRLSAFSATQLLTILDGLSSGRGSLWNYAWNAFLEKPFIGHGNAGFPIAYLKSAQLPPGFLAPSAHNLWLNVAVEYGVVGFIFLLSVLMILFKKIINYVSDVHVKQLKSSDAYLAAFLAFLGHHVFDAMLWVPSYLAAFTIIFVFLIRYTLPFGEWRLGRKSYTGIGLIIILPLAYSYILVNNIIAPSGIYGALELASKSANPYQNQICALANRYRRNALYSFECSMAIVQQISAGLPNWVDIEKVNLALHYQERGILLNPYWPPQQANLAVLSWLSGQQSIALEQMRQAATNAPRSSLIWLNLGWMEEKSGNFTEAMIAYDRALRLSPLMFNSSFKYNSTLFSSMSDSLEEWRISDEQWDDWYGFEVVDKAFLRGTMALALGDLDAALLDFQTSAERYKPLTPSYYAFLAYAQYLDGREESAYRIAYELALLDQRNLLKIEEPMLNSHLGFLLLKNGQKDLAYHLFMSSYRIQTRPTDSVYYTLVYRQPIIQTDLSPLLIRNLYILEETRPGWEWFVEQASLREPPIVAEQIAFWYQQLDGIALLENQ